MKHWCPACRAMRRVLDSHPESTYDGGSVRGREYAYLVLDLECGHEVSTDPVEIGDAP